MTVMVHSNVSGFHGLYRRWRKDINPFSPTLFLTVAKIRLRAILVKPTLFTFLTLGHSSAQS